MLAGSFRSLFLLLSFLDVRKQSDLFTESRMRRSKRCAVVGRTPNYGNVWRARATEDRGRGGGRGRTSSRKKKKKKKAAAAAAVLEFVVRALAGSVLALNAVRVRTVALAVCRPFCTPSPFYLLVLLAGALFYVLVLL